jgi:nitrate reductase assembly molybdenum cofactor insertion protein NarJ
MRTLDHYQQLAAVFDYPAADLPAQLRGLCESLQSRYPAAASRFEFFAKALPSSGERLSEIELDEVQEIFTRSFDVQAITTLSVGYIVFGDDYKRAELLVNLNREHRDAGLDCGTELSDHLPNVLRLLAKWQDPEIVVEFVEEILHPAIDNMIHEFGADRILERNRLYRKHYKTLIATSPDRGTMYIDALQGLLAVLRQDFDLAEHRRPEQRSDFLRSLGREMEIEAEDASPAQLGSTN